LNLTSPGKNCLSILSSSNYKKWSSLAINSVTKLVICNEHLVTVSYSLNGIEGNKLSTWMGTKEIKLDHATVMTMRGSKILNEWQRGKLIIFYGNEEIGIDFNGNERIFSFLYCSYGTVVSNTVNLH